jgi:cytochrome P450
MVNNPDAFKKAQEEIDRVIGDGRLIDYDDKDSLPYFAAVLREVLRWVRFRSSPSSREAWPSDQARGPQMGLPCTTW